MTRIRLLDVVTRLCINTKKVCDYKGQYKLQVYVSQFHHHTNTRCEKLLLILSTCVMRKCLYMKSTNDVTLQLCQRIVCLQPAHNWHIGHHISFCSQANSNLTSDKENISHRLQDSTESFKNEVDEKVVKTLAEIMECDVTTMSLMIEKYPFLYKNSKNLKDKIDVLKSFDLSVSFVMTHPKILRVSSSQTMAQRLNVLNDHGLIHYKSVLSDDSLAHCLYGEKEKFGEILEKSCVRKASLEGHTNKVEYLKYRLEISEDGDISIDTLIKDYPFLESIKPELLKEKIDVIKSFSLPLAFVQSHPRVLLQRTSKILVDRLNLINKQGLLSCPSLLSDSLLGYCLEVSITEFNKAFDRLCARKAALEGCEDKLQYLQFRLDVSEKTAANLLTQPHMSTVNEIKLKEHLDFYLLELGWSPVFVSNNLRLVGFSLKRHRLRLEIMEDAATNISPPGLVKYLVMSEKKFNKYFISL